MLTPRPAVRRREAAPRLLRARPRPFPGWGAFSCSGGLCAPVMRSPLASSLKLQDVCICTHVYICIQCVYL
jgi:hypothetical protein